MQAVAAQCWREVIRFLRQRSRVIGAAGQPLVFWLLFGVGLQGSFRPGGAEQGPSYLQYFFPGTLVLVLLFTAIFSTISIIEDRREGFLQSVLVAPAPRWAMVLGKVLGGSAIAMAQCLAVLALSWVLWGAASWQAAFQLTALLSIGAVALTALGFCIAWRMESTHGFHAVMNLFLMPMWLLSGAFFPAPELLEGVHWSQQSVHWVMRLNPLTYCVGGVRELMFDADGRAGWSPSMAACWIVSSLFAAAMLAAAFRAARRTVAGDLL